MLKGSDLKSIVDDLSGVLVQAPRAWLRVSGPDAAEFLQGQCTQDLRGLAAGQAVWALWLTIKGRVVGESLILRERSDQDAEGVWWLWSAYTGGEALRARLEEFIIADDVTVEDLGASGLWEHVTLAGPQAKAWLADQAGGAPGPGEWRRAGEGWVFQGRRGAAACWEWLRPLAGAACLPALGELRAETLVRARMATGVPAIPGEFGAGDLPQEAGLEAVAVSFTKGCYLGQEIMARLHAMGQVRRRLVRVAGDGPVPASGATLLHEVGGKRAGELRAAVDDGRGGWLGLAMVNLLGLDPLKALKLGDDTPVGTGWSVVLLDQAGAGEGA